MRAALVLSSLCVIGGLLLVWATSSLLGLLLITGGVLGLGWAMAPELTEQFAVFLSTGRFRRRSSK